MKVDLALAAVVLIFGLFGFLSGAIRQVTHWIGLALAIVLSRPLAARATPFAAPALGHSPAAVNVGLSAVFFVVLLIGGTMIARRLAAALFGDRENGSGDHAFGFALGAAKGGVLLYAFLSLLLYFEKPLTRAFGEPPAPVRDSKAVALVRAHDLFQKIPVPALAKLQKLADGAKDPRGLEALKDSPELKALLDDPQLKAALQNGDLSQALKSGDLSSLQNDPRLKALLNDPRLTGAK